MSRKPEIRTCGREPSCDIVLEDATLSRLHARIELAEDGLVSINDAGSSNGTYVKRNDIWIRVKRITLCIGDQVRFGDFEAPLERLTAVFGKDANVRLEARHFPFRHGKVTGSTKGKSGDGPSVHKPRRNPVTGKIEERPANT